MITTSTGEKLFDYTEVCELLGMSDATVRKYSRILGLELHSKDRKVHFAESQIRQLAEAMKAPKPHGRKGLTK